MDRFLTHKIYRSLLYIEYSKSKKQIIKFTYYDKDVDMDKLYNVVIRKFDFSNLKEFLNMDPQEILKNGSKRIVCTATTDALYEYLGSKEKLSNYHNDKRLNIIK